MPRKFSAPSDSSIPRGRRRARASKIVSSRKVKTKSRLERVLPLSIEEKHQLILAHQAARQSDRAQVASVWMGVIATCVVVISAWIWSVGPIVTRALHRPSDQEFQDLLKGVEAVQKNAQTQEVASEVARAAIQASVSLTQLSTQTNLGQPAVDRMTTSSRSSSASQDPSVRSNLFYPTPTSSIVVTSTSSSSSSR